MRKIALIGFMFLISVQIQAGEKPPKYTFKEPYPGAPVVYINDMGKKVYVVPEPTDETESDQGESTALPTAVSDNQNKQVSEEDSAQNPSVKVSVAAEGGYHSFDTSTIGLEALAQSYVNLLKSHGWSNAAETHSLNVSNLYEGVNLDFQFEKFQIGGGYRYYNLGNGQLTAQGSSNTPFPQYSTIKDTQTVIADNWFLSVGALEYLSAADKIYFALDGGLATSTSTDAFSWETYNGSYSKLYSNTTFTGEGYQYTIKVGIENFISKSFKIGIDAGYKIYRIETFRYTSVDSNIASKPKPGDTVYDANNQPYALKLDGLMAGLKIAYIF